VVQIKTSLRARQNDGTRIITKEDRAQRETTGMFWGMIPTTFTSSIARRLKEMASRYIACSKLPSYTLWCFVGGCRHEARCSE
jgi:hypothetical protein